MAEEKKSIKLQKLSEKPLNEYCEAVGDPEGKPSNGSVNAAVAALAAELGALAAASAEEGKLDPDVLKELGEIGKYMLKQVDETVRSRAPLLKRLAEGATPEELESAARVACGIPNEIVYIMCRTLELLDPVADACSDEMVPNVLGAVYLALGVIAAMRGEIKAVSKHMMEFTFRYTVNREAELNLQNHQELIDSLMTKLNARLEK
jgi:formiminotetrahydrofolate cyclodeaminase